MSCRGRRDCSSCGRLYGNCTRGRGRQRLLHLQGEGLDHPIQVSIGLVGGKLDVSTIYKSRVRPQRYSDSLL